LRDQTQIIKDAETAKNFLVRTEYIPIQAEVTVELPINNILYVSSDKGVGKRITNVLRSVAFLLKSMNVTSQCQLMANLIADDKLDQNWSTDEGPIYENGEPHLSYPN